MRGANPTKLEDTVKQYQGEAVETAYHVPGHVSKINYI